MNVNVATYGWKLGLFIAICLPLIYVLQMVTLLSGISQQSLLVQILLNAVQIIPSIAMAMGVGVIICLLVRIEGHLRQGADRE